MKYLPAISAAVVVLLGIAITLGIDSGFRASNEQATRESVAVVAEYAQSDIEGRIASRLDALARLADIWTQLGPLDEERWHFYADLIRRDLSGFQAIEWIDRDFMVRWISPIAGNEAAIDLDITFEPRRKAAVEAARDLHAPSMSRTIDLVQGGKGFLAYYPLYREDTFEGFVVGVFRVRELLHQVIPRGVPDEFELAIFDQDEQVFVDAAVENPNTRMATALPISLPGVSWRLRVTPDDRLDRNIYRVLTRLSTMSAIVITLLVSISVYLALAFWMRRQEVQAANTRLSDQVARRERAELDLLEHLDELEKLVATRTAEIREVNVSLEQEVELHQRAKAKLEHNQSRLRHLTLDLSLSEERFRKQIAEKIHDRVSNGLVLAKLRLGELTEGLSASGAATLDDINQILSATIEESRSMVFEISPPILFELGLANAVEWYANSTLAEHGLRFSLNFHEPFETLEPDLAAAMYRAYTELCMNVIKHAAATQVEITVEQQSGNICISVADDGVGIEPGRELAAAASGASYGLFSIRERFAGLGGAMEIGVSELGGTSVLIYAPIRTEELS